MSTFFYVPQYFTTQLSVAGGIDDTQTTGIVLQDISGVDDTKPGIIALTWSNPIDTTKIEYIFYTSINSSTKELQGVTRGQEGYSAKSHLNGATVAWPLSKSHINNIPDSTTIFTNKDLTSPTNILGSWNSANETWTYVSTDDPTGIFKVNADVTGKYSAGMRIKMTNGGNVIHGIITKMGTYGGTESGYTYITFLHEIDPTDNLALYLMANSAITANYYSTAKAPFGFPQNITHWQILVTDSTNRTGTPTNDTWWNPGGSISVPIGRWKIGYGVFVRNTATSATYIFAMATLSSANNSESELLLTSSSGLEVSSSSFTVGVFCRGELIKNITSKTTYYLNNKIQTNGTISGNNGFFNQWNFPSKIYLICDYL